jgi:hypothetical protein
MVIKKDKILIVRDMKKDLGQGWHPQEPCLVFLVEKSCFQVLYIYDLFECPGSKLSFLNGNDFCVNVQVIV